MNDISSRTATQAPTGATEMASPSQKCENAVKLAFASHGVMVVFLLVLYEPTVLLGPVYLAGVALVTGLLVYEHSLVKKDDLSKVNTAFFNINGIISIGLMVFVIVDCVWV